MATEVDVYNMALSAIGARSSVSEVDEDSEEAAACTLWYDTVRDNVLEAANWPSANAFKRLAVTVERDFSEDWLITDPHPDFRYAYSPPADMLRPRFLSTWERFTVGLVNGQKKIMANTEDAILAYTAKQTVIDAWDASLKMAIVYALAGFVAIPVTGKLARGQWALGLANELILQARVRAANEKENSFESIPDWIAARGYSGAVSPTRYAYPLGGLLSLPVVASAS